MLSVQSRRLYPSLTSFAHRSRRVPCGRSASTMFRDFYGSIVSPEPHETLGDILELNIAGFHGMNSV